MAVPTFTGPRVTTDANNTPTVDALLPVGTVEGDNLLIIAGSDATASTTFSAPNYLSEGVAGDTNSDAQIGVLYGTATATNITNGYVRVTQGASTEMWAAIYNHNGVLAPHVSSFSSAEPLNPHLLGSVTTTINDCLLFAGLSHDGADGDPFTVDQDQSSATWDAATPTDINAGTGGNEAGGCVLDAELVTSGSTGDLWIDAQTSDGAAYAIIAIKPVTAVPVTVNVTGVEGTGSVGSVTVVAESGSPVTVIVTGLEAVAESIGGEQSIDTYYIDGHTSIIDVFNTWTQDSDAFDGNILTTSAFTSTNNATLRGTGSTAPATGENITLVEWRTTYAASVFTDHAFSMTVLDGVQSLGNHSVVSDTTQTTTAWLTLDVPTGGWDWSKVNGLVGNANFTEGGS